MPIVTCSTRTLTSRLRAFAAMSVVKRNAPSSTCSAALNSSFAGCISDRTSLPFSPSFTRLPSDSFTTMRASLPLTMRSPARSSIPGTSGARVPSRSRHAGICTPSITAAGCASAWVDATPKSNAKSSALIWIPVPPLYGLGAHWMR